MTDPGRPSSAAGDTQWQRSRNEAVPSSPIGISGSLLAEPPRPPTEAEAREMRRREREAGVEFWLKDTGLAARVRDLPFTDRVMLRGIPADMRVSVGQTLSEAKRLAGTTIDITASLSLLQSNVELIEATCLTGFIWPRLVRSEPERDALLSRDSSLRREDVWLIDSLSDNEKEEYFTFVFRPRTDGAKEDAARFATFPGARVAEARVGEPGDALRQAAV